MAWEKLEFGAVHGVTGDAPFDELHRALSSIRQTFLKHVGRPPYFSELLRVLLATVATDPSTYVADTTRPIAEWQLDQREVPQIASEGLRSKDIRGAMGDGPFDEMRSAVNRIRRSYLERFGRNPYFAELLYPMRMTVQAEPPGYVTDTTLPTLDQLAHWAGTGTTSEHIDPGHFEAGIDEETGDFLVFPRGTPTKPQTRDSMVLRGEVIESGDNGVLCRYTVLSPSLSDGMARSLIRQCVLQDLLDHNVVDGNLKIRFERTA